MLHWNVKKAHNFDDTINTFLHKERICITNRYLYTFAEISLKPSRVIHEVEYGLSIRMNKKSFIIRLNTINRHCNDAVL